MAKRIGIYSGTFDPVHPGHIAFALAAREQCRLEVVVFLPEASPRSKTGVSPLEHRVTLLRSAISGQEGLDIAILTTPRFTVQATLPEIEAHFPGAHLTLLAGSDVVPSLLRWEGIGTLLSKISLAVGMRANDSPKAVEQVLAQLAEQGHNFEHTLIHTEYAHLSSSQLRQAA